MKTPGSLSLLFFFIFLIVGGILGGIVGEALYAVPALKGILPALTQHYEILNIQNIHLNLYLMASTWLRTCSASSASSWQPSSSVIFSNLGGITCLS